MVKKLQSKPSKTKSTDMPSSVKDSAQQIWQAGLAAFTRAQAEGSKAFESLVKEGVGIQRKTQNAAEEKMAEAGHKMSSMASDISSKASGQWDKLETIFEDRVAKALGKLGVPSAKEVKALIDRIDALDAAVKKLSARSGPAATPAKKKAPAPAPAAPRTRAKQAASPQAPAKASAAKKAPAKKPAAKPAAPAATGTP